MKYDDLVKRMREDVPTALANCDFDFVEGWSKEAADAIEELRKAVLRLENERGIYDELPTFYIYPTKWIPVTEQLPDENDVVLITDSLDVGTGYLVHGYGWISPFDDIETSHVSHWMPLPEPPKEEGEDDV